jgi:hypothetical protein
MNNELLIGINKKLEIDSGEKDRPRRPWLGRSRRGDLQNNEFDLTIRPVMVRALIVAHEPRQARIAGQLNVRTSRFARGENG